MNASKLRKSGLLDSIKSKVPRRKVEVVEFVNCKVHFGRSAEDTSKLLGENREISSTKLKKASGDEERKDSQHDEKGTRRKRSSDSYDKDNHSSISRSMSGSDSK